MTSEISLKNQWLVTVELNGVPAEFNINTGAEVMVITEDLYHQEVVSYCLTVPDQSANNQSLSIQGMPLLLHVMLNNNVMSSQA